MTPKYPPFASSERICKAASAPGQWFKYGETGEGTAILQGALIVLGYKLPRSTRKGGQPDGIYGDETFAAIQKFQGQPPSITPDGFAGRSTISKLDVALVSKSPAKPKVPPKILPGLVRKEARYKIGTTKPHNPVDVGAGPWGVKPAEATYQAMHTALLTKLKIGSLSIWALTGPNAIRHMRHYLENTGKDLRINLENMVASVPRARKRMDREVYQAKVFCQSLPPGTHQIVSEFVQTDHIPKAESSDWYFAMNGYQSWGSGTVTVVQPATGPKKYTLQFTYHTFDPYTWDGGKAVDLGGIIVTDESVGEFHRQGLARQYNQIGAIHRQFTWSHGERVKENNNQPIPDTSGPRTIGRTAGNPQ